MQTNKLSKFAANSVKSLGLVLASSCLMYTLADAAGLGKLTVLSSLGQPLRAEIELTSVTKADAGSLYAKLANYQDFHNQNIEFNPNLSSLNFAIEDRDGRHFVLITSTQAINEPYMEILIELTSSSGRLIREYPMLLDAQNLSSLHVASVENKSPTKSADNASTSKLDPASKKLNSSPADVKPAKPEEREKPAATASAKNGEVYYQIKNGDTLGEIANQFHHQGISLEQMLVAIQRRNPSAIIKGNMNLIRAGAILTIPTASEVESITHSEAKDTVVAHAVDFNAYRDKLANQVEDAKPEQKLATKKIDSGKITAKVVESPTPVNESLDKLKLSDAQIAAQAESKITEEEKVAKQKALEIANARVKELEQNTAKLQQVLDMHDKAIQTAQGTTDGNAQSATAQVSQVPAVLPPVKANVPTPATPVKPTKPVEPPALVASNSIDWQRYLPYGGIVLALLAGLGIYARTRNKKAKRFDDGVGLEDAGTESETHLFVEAADSSDDANGNSFGSNLIAPKQLIQEEAIDPLAQADIYIAYGREEQAEQILKEALRNEPQQHAFRTKLLEMYAHRNDVLRFGVEASELYVMTGGIGFEWDQVAEMGRTIDPQNIMYSNEPKATEAESSVVQAQAQAEGNVVIEQINQPITATQTFSGTDSVEVHIDTKSSAPELDSFNLDFDITTPKKEELIQIETKNRPQFIEATNDLGSSLPETGEVVSEIRVPNLMEFDLSGIDLELPTLQIEPVITQVQDHVDETIPTISMANFDITEQKVSVEVADETETKLDLAVAYKKIGDKDGARELLGEVLRSGNHDQSTRAKALMHELD